MSDTDSSAMAREIYDALRGANAITPFSARGAAIDRSAAYCVADQVRSLKAERRVGRKIGFTNRSLWPRYGVDGPIWGDVSEMTVLRPNVPASLAPYVEPRIEPEIALCLSARPDRSMSDEALAACIDWAAPSFEIVQSIYPGWAFDASDAIAACGLHGGLLIGPRHSADAALIDGLPAVSVALSKNGEVFEDGVGANALDGPISALKHLVDVLDKDNALQAGEIITTGTLTDAWPIARGEVWRAEYKGALSGEIELVFA